MRPYHDDLAPTRPGQPQRLTPDLLLLASDPIDLLLLLLLTTLNVLVLSRSPLRLTALLHKLAAVLLEGRHCEQHELVILGHLDARPGHDHGRERLVALEKFFPAVDGDCDEVCLKVLGIGDEDLGVDNGREGFGG